MNPRALTFDCYGTLVDWDRGIEEAIAGLPSLRTLPEWTRGRIRARREAVELERWLPREWRPYREILAGSLREAAEESGVEVPESEAASFAATMGSWPPHPDAPPALARLRRRFRLAILSNVDRATLAETVRLLGVPFDLLVAADDVRSYKPAPAHFERAFEGLALRPDEILHVSYSADHDLRPCEALGIPTAWVNRAGDEPPPGIQPAFFARDLLALADSLAA